MSASPGGVEVGRVSVRVLPDTSRLFAELEADLKKIEAQTSLSVNATIDSARLDAEAREAVAQAELAAGDIHVNVDVDTSQVREAESAFGAAASSAQGFGSGISGILATVLILGPALIPLTAAIAGLGAALVAPLAIAGGGLTVFGLIAGFTISETQKQLKVINQLDTKLSGLTKGTQEYADTAAQLRTAQAALTPAQKAFAAALTGVKTAFNNIPKSIVLKPITEGLDLLAHALPLVEPILRAVSGVITDIIGDFDKAARSAGFKTFVESFAKQLGPDLRAFASIAGNVFSGLFGLFGAFNSQLSGSVLSSLENLTQKFANWGQTVGQSKGFRAFVDYVKGIAPVVAHALGQIAGAATDIVQAFAPVGGTVVTIVGNLAGAISKIPADTLATLATALVGLVAASKVAGPVTTLFSGIAAAPEIALVVAAVAALAGGFIVLFQNSKPLRTILGDFADFFKTSLLPRLEDAAKKALPSFKDALHNINNTLRDNKPFIEGLGKAILTLTSDVVIGAIGQLAIAIRGIGLAFKYGVPLMRFFADVALGAFRVVVAGLTFFAQVALGAFGVIVDGAAAAFGWIPGLGGKIKAAQAKFHEFSDGVIGDLKAAGAKLKALQDQIDGKHVFKVDVDDLAAVKKLHALQDFQIRDKSFTITENFIERTPGPGGGMGRPAPNNGDGGSGSGGSSGKALVNVENMHTTDTSDILKKSVNVLRQRAGGGVVLAGSNG